MKNNNQKKSKNMIFIIWVLFISTVILVITILFLLFLKPTISNSKQQEPFSNVEINKKQSQETYNMLLNKIETEIEKLTPQPEQTPLLKHPPKVKYYDDGKKIQCIDEYNQDTGKLSKSTEYDKNGNISLLEKYQKGYLSKAIYFNPDGTVKEIINH